MAKGAGPVDRHRGASIRQTMTVPQFIGALKDLSESHGIYENFRHFMEASYVALANRTVTSRWRRDALEERYMSVIRHYGDEKEYPQRLAMLFGRLVDTLSRSTEDYLGEVYTRAEFANAHSGQYFTPTSISRLMTRLTTSRKQLEAQLASRGRVTFLDPAAGSGSIAIAFAEYLMEEGFDPSRQLLMTLIDKDLLCVQMAFVQLFCQGLPAVCVHADTMLLKEHSFAVTRAGARMLGLPIWGIHEMPPPGFDLKLDAWLTVTRDTPTASEDNRATIPEATTSGGAAPTPSAPPDSKPDPLDLFKWDPGSS